MKVLRLSPLNTGRLYPPGNTPGTHFCQRLGRPQGHIATGGIRLMENPNDTTRNRKRNFRVVPQLVNLLTPNVNYSGRTAPLTSKVAFYIFIQQI